MKLQTLVLSAVAAFAFGAALAIGSVQAAGGCITCHNKCDTNFEACLAAGTSYATCSSRLTLCRRGCGCPVP